MSKKKPAKEKEALPAIQTRKIIVSGPQRHIFVIDDADKLTDVSALQCISLMHPKHGKPSRYLHTSTHLWEVQRVYQPPSSWLIGHDVAEDGSLYLCTLVDPLFLLLALLERGRGKRSVESSGNFMQFDQLVPKDAFPSTLLPACAAQVRSHLCDTRDGWNEPVLRLNDDKVVAWLRKKTERMYQDRLKSIKCLSHLYTDAERNGRTTSPPEAAAAAASAAAAAADSVAAPAAASSSKEKKETDAAASSSPSADPAAAAASSASPAPRAPPCASLKQSLQLLSEYLAPHFFLLLLQSYQLGLEDIFERKRVAPKAWEASASGKITGDIDTSRAAGGGGGAASADKRKAEKPISSAAKKLATAAKGTKSLASFFGKKG